MIHWMMVAGFQNTCTISMKWNVPTFVPGPYRCVYKFLRLPLVELWFSSEVFPLSGFRMVIITVCSQSRDPKFEYLFAFQFWYYEFCMKTNEEGKGVETIILLIFAFRGCFSCWWVRGDGVGQKVLFSGSLNLIFCLSPRLKSWSVKGASRHPVFMILVLIKEIRRGCKYKISSSFPQTFESFHSDLLRRRWRNLVLVEYLWMIEWVVVCFCSVGGWCFSGWWVWDLRKLAQL